MVWSRDWDDTWCGLGTGTIPWFRDWDDRCVVEGLERYMVWSRDWDDTWCGLGTGTIHGVV